MLFQRLLSWSAAFSTTGTTARWAERTLEFFEAGHAFGYQSKAILLKRLLVVQLHLLLDGRRISSAKDDFLHAVGHLQ